MGPMSDAGGNFLCKPYGSDYDNVIMNLSLAFDNVRLFFNFRFISSSFSFSPPSFVIYSRHFSFSFSYLAVERQYNNPRKILDHFKHFFHHGSKQLQ